MAGTHKDIDPAALASLTTGVLMTDFPKVHETAEWIIGHPVWTHELPSLSDRLSELAFAQFPELPKNIESTWEATRDAVRARYGETVAVRRGTDERAADAVTTAKAAFHQGTAH